MRLYLMTLRSAKTKILFILAMVVLSSAGTWIVAQADEALPSATPDFPSVMRAHGDQLAKIVSDRDALKLFASSIGPALQMGDAAKTLGVNPLPPKVAKELLVTDLTVAANRLMSSLAAWQLASTVRQSLKDQQITTVTERLSNASQNRLWLDQQGAVSWHASLSQLSDTIASPEWAKGDQGESAATLLTIALDRAARLEVDALQASYQEWDRIRNWKDRVRGLRGQTRLCGTWQWTIHNHQQHHQEQKLSLLFPPAGNKQTTLPGLVETIVLGDNVYLRWEIDGQVQEDSLQFTKEGKGLDGTFVNSQGGWGSISGKRTAGCTP